MLILIVLLIRWRKTFSSTLQRSMYPFGYILHIDQSMSILTNIVMEVAMFYFYITEDPPTHWPIRQKGTQYPDPL